MLKPGSEDEKAALIFDDMASAIDAALPLRSIGGNPDLGDDVLVALASQRGIHVLPTEKTVLQLSWKSGNGAAALRSRAANRRRRAKFKQDVWGGLRYPVLLLCVIAVAAVCTSTIIGTEIGIWIACGAFAIALSAIVLGRKIMRGDAALERYPVLGSLLIDVHELPYLESLHALYGAGVPIVEAHKRALESVHSQGLRERLKNTQQLMEAGATLREALKQSSGLTEETRSLLATGEDSGQLEEALQRALVRRQDVAEQKLVTASLRVGQTAYALGVIAAVIVIFKFYSGYFALLGIS